MRLLEKHATLNERGSAQSAVLIMTAAFALAVAGYLAFGQGPVKQAEKNRSGARSALENAGFSQLADDVYGKR